jgi:hypothetical protein
MNTMGAMTIIINIRICTLGEITNSARDMSAKVSPTLNSIARRVKSLPFVTDVR